MTKSTDDSAFAQRLWRRYTRFSTVAPHTRLARRIYRMHSDHVPLLHTLQRRWSPAVGASFPTNTALPYVQLPVFLGGPQLAPATVQRSPARIGKSGQLSATKPVVAVPRTGTRPLTVGPVAGDANPGVAVVQRSLTTAHTPLVQRLSVLPTAAPDHRSLVALKNVPGNLTPAAPSGLPAVATSLPSPPSSGASLIGRSSRRASIVQRVTAPSSVVQSTAVLGDAILRRHLARATNPRPLDPLPQRVTVMPTHSPGAVPATQFSVTAPLPILQRQADEGHAMRQLPVAGVQSAIPIPMPSPTPVASAVALPVSRAAVRGIVARQTGPVSAAPMITSSPTRATPAGVHSAALPPATMVMPAFSKGPASPLSIARFQPAPLIQAPINRAGPTSLGPTPANILPLMRAMASPNVTLLSRPLGSGEPGPSQGPSLLRQTINGHMPLPLVTPTVSGRATALHRQPTQPPGMDTTTTSPSLAVNPAMPTETAPATGQANQNQLDELTDQVWRKLLRRLAVEGERRGGRS